MLSERIKKIPANHILAEAHFRCARNPWSSDNPDGFINLGTAEHGLLCPEMNNFFQQAPVAVEEDFHYQCLHGKHCARQKIAQWLSCRAGRELDPDKVVLASSATAIIEAVGFALCDPGDGLLIPAPCYSGFHYDLESRAGVHLEYIPCWAEDDFALLPENIEAAIERASGRGLKVRGLLLHSPGNPVGRVYSESELKLFSELCGQANIQLIVDEVCSDTTFEGVEFVSALTLDQPHVHIIHSLGKGYGMAGLSTGLFYSDNAEVVQAVGCQAYFARMPNHLQTQIVWLLGQSETAEILQRSRHQLASVAAELVRQFKSVGVITAPARAGVYMWIHLGAVLGLEDFEAEQSLFEALMREVRLNISPGQFFSAPEPGWFRLCFSVPPLQLSTGVQRLMLFIESKVLPEMPVSLV